MVRITEELIRKKSEHNELVIGTLEELSLHQEDVEKIEHVQNWCKELQILYLQSNLISKIENLHKLKKLQYLNLAINNVEKIENLERCESLEKLDLTLNFVGDLASVESLRDNFNLRHLYLTGNPCTDYPGYRDYVIAKLPQLESLDNRDVLRSERIKAIQRLPQIEPGIARAFSEYEEFRREQRRRLAELDTSLDDDEFWKRSSEHAPETRVEIARRTRLARGKDKEPEAGRKRIVATFSKEGRPLNVNQAKLEFRFDDSDPSKYVLDVSVYRYLDSAHLKVDLEPIYVRVTVKDKVFQFVFPEEVATDRSTAQRSQTTGHLVLTMPRVNYKPSPFPVVSKKHESQNPAEIRSSYLEVGGADMDFSRIVADDFDPDVPPLEYAV